MARVTPHFRYIFSLFCTAIFTGVFSTAQATDWPQFLGPTLNGHAPAECDPPLVWSETQNVVWKTPIHDLGWSSPVIAKDQVWMTTATEDGKELFAVCVNKNSGEIVHDIKVFDVAEPQKKNGMNSYASPTPVVEEGRVYVSFGYAGLACLDTATGRTIWSRRDFVCDHHNNAPGSSPVMYKNLLIFPVDGIDVQYIAAVDRKTGDTVWKTDRSFDYSDIVIDCKKAYGTPLVLNVNGKDWLISCAAQEGYAYDPATGRERWHVTYPGGFSNTPVPGFWNGNIILNTGFTSAMYLCFPLECQGNIADDSILWTFAKNVPLCATAAVVGDAMYFCDGQGVATCLNLETGEARWSERFGGNFWASPVVVKNRIYFFDDNGTTTVIEATPKECNVLRKNELETGCMATPAVSGNRLYIRTKTDIYCIGQS